MSIQSNFPAISPSLNLSFALTKALDPRISFSRASTATYYGTQTAKAEENFVLYSQEFDNAAWTKTNSTVAANSEVAPDGTTTADTLTGNGVSGTHVVQNNVVISFSNSPHTVSVFAKAGTNNFIQLRFFAALGAAFANFDLATGVVGTTGNGASSSIVSVGNGWYRCSMTATTTASASGGFNFLLVTSDSAAGNETNTLSTSVYLWGAQLEQRSVATAYTPTTTQPITNYIPVLETAAADVARFDHNPTTFESLGLLIEEQRTNTTNYSEQFDNNWWVEARSTITANVIVSPDGTVDADKLIEDTTASNTHYIRSTAYSTVSGTSYTWSIFLKAGERTKARVALQLFLSGSAYPTTNPRVDVDLVTGTLSNAFGTIGTSITNAGNGWYRVAVSATANANAADQLAGVFLLDGAGEQTYTGDGYSGIFIWGAQLEAGAFVTSYIQTVASQVTRAAEAASMTGTNFSSWYSQGQGTIYVETEGQLSTPTAWSASITDAANTEIATIRNFNNTARFGVQGVASGSAGATVAGVPYKAAFAFSSGNQGMSVNGATTLSGTTAMTSEASLLRLANNPAGNSFFTTRIRKLAYYPIRCTNAQLQGLTS
jgi:hypothetical protein